MDSGPGGAHDVLVVGGGFAGLSAATALAERGARVLVLEARPYLGGRARSWVDPETGAVVDNGQHLFLGCYHETLRFLDRIGGREGLALQPRFELPFAEADGAVRAARLPSLPGVWGLVLGCLTFPGLRVTERLGLLRVGRAVARLRGPGDAAALDDRSVDEWLAGLRQGREAVRRLWGPLAVAALNEETRRASAAVFAPVLREAFLSGADGARLGLARVGLSALYADPAAHYLRARRGEVRLRAQVRRLVIENGRFAWALLTDGTRLRAGALVAAVPPDDLLGIVPPEAAAAPWLAGASRLAASPIVSVYLWFGVPVLDRPLCGILDGAWQWVFSRSAFDGAAAGRHGVTLVRSAARDLVERPRESLVRSALEDLHARFPVSRRAALRHSLVVKERKATFSPAPRTLGLRPSGRTPWRGVHLAGDWTATGLPATIEGAVRSGHACARQVAEEGA